MSDKPQAASAAQSQPWDPARASFHGLNVRVLRLAIALGVSLANPQDVDKVLRLGARTAPAVDRRGTPDRRGGSRSGNGSDRRVAHQWAELRGLLVLRYGLQKQCLDDFGLDVTRRLVAQVLTDLQREGFDPASAGIEVSRTDDLARRADSPDFG